MNVFYYKDEKLCQENILGKAFFPFFYKFRFGKLLHVLLVRPWVSKFVGWFVKTRWSCHYIKPFIKKFSIVESDFVEPKNGFASFNDFFIRVLRPGARMIDQNEAVFVAPADSKLLVIPNILSTDSFVIKDNKFTLAAFLGNVQQAQEYEGGCLMIFRLAPYDYHRYHFPMAALVQDCKEIKGILGSVNPLAYQFKKQPLIENQRSIITLETKQFDTIFAIPVGALFVGAIHHSFRVGAQAIKGDEMGYFSYGGSTLVILCKPNKVKIDPIFIKHSLAGFETAVLMGQAIGINI